MAGSKIGLRAAGAGVALLFGLVLSGCTAGTGVSGGATPGANPSADPSTPAVVADCQAIGEVLIAFTTAAFSGISTQAKNSDVAAAFQAAADQFDQTEAPAGATQWENLGAVIHAYASEWAALPADGTPLESLEQIEAKVDALAESKGFDNNDYSDLAAIVGSDCADELKGLGLGG